MNYRPITLPLLVALVLVALALQGLLEGIPVKLYNDTPQKLTVSMCEGAAPCRQLSVAKKGISKAINVEQATQVQISGGAYKPLMLGLAQLNENKERERYEYHIEARDGQLALRVQESLAYFWNN